MIDLDECNRVKTLLNQHPEDYREIIEQTSLAVCITDGNGIFTAVNENYRLMYGYEKGEMEGKSFLMVVQDQQKDNLQELHDIFMKLRDEIMRNWVVQAKSGEKFAIFADAGYSAAIEGSPHKVTFIWPKDKKFQQLLRDQRPTP